MKSLSLIFDSLTSSMQSERLHGKRLPVNAQMVFSGFDIAFEIVFEFNQQAQYCSLKYVCNRLLE